MVKRIRHVSELPSWYSLEKYHDVSKLDCLGWYWQLSARLEVDNFVTWFLPDVADYFRTDAHFSELFAISTELLEAVRNCPIFDHTTPYIASKFIGKFLLAPIESGVRYASLLDLHNHLSGLSESKQKMGRNYLCGKDKSNDRRSLSSVLLDAPNGFTDGVLLNVSLELPDRLLIRSFAAFIRKIKGSRGINEIEGFRHRKPDFNEWVRLGVLPYIDLKTWEKENIEDVKIPNRVMADAIFPSGEGGEEVVRKTTEKLAYELLNVNMLNILAALHIHGETKGNT